MTKKTICLFAPLILHCYFFSQAFGQEPSDTLRAHVWDSLVIECLETGQADSSRLYLDSLRAFRGRFPGTDSLNLADWYFFEAMYCNLKGQPAQGVKYMQEVKRLREKSTHFDPVSHSAAFVYNMLGLLLSNAGEHELALQQHLLAMDIREKLERRDAAFDFKNMTANSYANVGQELGSLGQPDRSIAYILRALPAIRDSALNHKNKMRGFLAALYLNLAANYMGAHEHELAEQHFERALNMMPSRLGFKDFDLFLSSNLAHMWLDRGLNFAFLGRYETADSCIEKAKGILARVFPGEAHSYLLGVALNMQGMIALDQDKFELSYAYLQEAASIMDLREDGAHAVRSNVYHNMGVNWSFRNMPDSALHYIRFAKLILGTPTEPSLNLDFVKYCASENRALVQKYKQDGSTSPSLLDTVVANTLRIEAMYDHFVSSLEGELRYFNWAYALKQVVEPAVSACYFLHQHDRKEVHLETAFRFAEKTKAISWLEKYRLQQASASGHQLSEDERQFRKKQADLRVQRFAAQLQSDSTIVDNVSRQMFDLVQQRQQLQSNASRPMPASKDVVAADSVQRYLAPDEVMLAYFLGDSSAFIFALTRERLHLEMVPNIHLAPDVRRLAYAMRSSETPREEFIEAAQYLYAMLVLPVKRLLPVGSRLVVIPDGVLCELPFEALFEGDATNFPNVDYLVKQYSFRYGYSATAMLEMSAKRHVSMPESEFLGMAPVFAGKQISQSRDLVYENPLKYTFDSLQYNVPEVRRVRKILGAGDILIGPKATKSRFVQLAGNYRIILLSTHALRNNVVNEHSVIAFSESADKRHENRLLLLSEIETLTLNSDLLVLGACQTGAGQIRNGDGVVSMARMFAFAGAKSLLSSLWNVNDPTSALLMELFFANLKKGMPKDQALQQAQRTYLNKPPSAYQRHPFFWATYVLSGDAKPL